MTNFLTGLHRIVWGAPTLILILGTGLFLSVRTRFVQLRLLPRALRQMARSLRRKPGEDGISILKKLRDRGDTGDIPVIMATAKGTEYDKVMGLDLGADDYLAKPFGMMEMISRVRAVLRRTAPNETQRQLRAGELVMDRARHTVQVAGTEVRLTLKEYELLQLLLESPSRVFSREQLLSAVWGANFLGETRTVDVHIGTLRTKLGSAGALIETVRGVGYRLGVRHE